MSFFADLFGAKRVRSIALLDIGSGSVGGAYALLTPDALPQVIYATRLPIEIRGNETSEQAMERTLRTLGNELAKEGAPELLRVSSSGTADIVLAAVSAPWQETSIRIEEIEEKRPFVFSYEHLEKALLSSPKVPKGRILVDESPIGVLLNGYATKDPFGKETRHASVIMLASTVNEQTVVDVGAVLRGLFHTKEILLIAGASLRYQALHALFPHERDYLILDASGPEIATALVRNGLLVATHDLKNVVSSETHWPDEVRVVLRHIAEGYPLPHNLFLIASEQRRAALKEALTSEKLGSLWLSDARPTVTAITSSHVTAMVKLSARGLPDLPLLLMALYAQSSLRNGAFKV